MVKTSKKTSAHQSAASQSIDTQVSLGAGQVAANDPAPDGPKRPPRIRLHSGQNLHVPEQLLDRKNFAYRWFAENALKGGRVVSAEGAWWVKFAGPDGHNFKRPSGEDTMYLMQLPIEYWLEDQEYKRNKSLATMDKESIIGEGEYAPTTDGKAEGGKSAVTRSPG